MNRENQQPSRYSQNEGRWHKQGKPLTVKEKVEYKEQKMAETLNTFADMMIEKIKSFGDGESWEKPWFSDKAIQWPKSIKGRNYSGMNAFMLMMHSEEKGYHVPIFTTFESVHYLNGKKAKDGKWEPATDKDGKRLPMAHVLKGEKSFPVLLSVPVVENKDTKDKIPYDDYRNLSDEQKKDYSVRNSTKVYYVFNIDQTNLKEARPELYQKFVNQYAHPSPVQKDGQSFTFQPMDMMIDKQEWLCPIKPTHGDQAYYSISKDEIVIPEKEQFKDGESFYTNTFHEMVHSTGAKDRLNRLKPGEQFGSSGYGIEELVAEMGAAMVGQHYGMTKNLKKDSAAYLASWLKNLKESPDFIKTVLKEVQKASSILIERIDKMQLQIDKENKLDAREEEDDEDEIVGEDMDSDDGIVVTESVGVQPDKKQGENEGQLQEEDNPHRHAPYRGR